MFEWVAVFYGALTEVSYVVSYFCKRSTHDPKKGKECALFPSRPSVNDQKRIILQINSLRLSVEEIEQGLIDAFLGSHLIKKRVARKGQGKSGGYRTILAYVEGEKAFFLYGFAKNEAENISSEELRALQLIGAQFLSYDDEKIVYLIEEGEVFEIEED